MDSRGTLDQGLNCGNAIVIPKLIVVWGATGGISSRPGPAPPACIWISCMSRVQMSKGVKITRVPADDEVLVAGLQGIL